MDLIAFYLRGYVQEPEDRDRVIAVMVGDYREHIALLNDDGCGQIGCPW